VLAGERTQTVVGLRLRRRRSRWPWIFLVYHATDDEPLAGW